MSVKTFWKLPYRLSLGTKCKINQNPGNQPLVFELLDGNHNLITTATKNKFAFDELTNGTYFYRVRGDINRPVDFTIKSVRRN